MKKPDRFEQMVTTACGTAYGCTYQQMVALLRRQHRAYVRLVWRVGDAVDAGESATSAIGKTIAAFACYRKGKP